MTVIASIVEGDGEVAALPVLLRRLSAWISPDAHLQVEFPIRVRRDRFLNRDEEFSRMIKLAASKCGPSGWIMVVLDADNDCPMHLAQQISAKAHSIVPRQRISVVLANREYEAWFIAAAASLNGQRGFSLVGVEKRDPDSIRAAKEWISERILNGKYREVTDQPAFTARMDLAQARAQSRSFRKLCDEWTRHMVVNDPPQDS